jgi:hypothetical protein
VSAAIAMPPALRVFAQPTSATFTSPPVKALLARYLAGVSVDPFARGSSLATITNDLDPNQPAQYHMHAEEFADLLTAQGVVADVILLDPPYSYRQCIEVYKSVGREWLTDDQQQVCRWSRLKDKLAMMLRPGGIAISFGWNTNGFGKSRGFEALEYLCIAHGSAHNDTLVTVERKIPQGELSFTSCDCGRSAGEPHSFDCPSLQGSDKP